MTAHWEDREEFRQLPGICQLWIWYCKHGFKRKSDTGTVGANFLFRLMRRILKHFPVGKDNLFPVFSARRNMSIVIDLIDFEIYQHTIRLFAGGSTESVMQEMLLEPGATFIDIGANHGTYSLFAAQHVGATGRVLAVEPQPRLAEAIRWSAKLNEMTNLSVHQHAMGDKPGDANFFLATSSSGSATLFPGKLEQAGEAIRTRMETLDDFISANNVTQIRLIKVDAEGAEARIFRGASGSLRKFTPYLWFEFDPSALHEAGDSSTSLIEFLRQLGYDRFMNVASVVHRDPENVQVDQFQNVLAVHHDKEQEFRELLNRRIGDKAMDHSMLDSH